MQTNVNSSVTMSSSNQGETPISSSMHSSATVHTSTSIKLALMNNRKNFRVQSNPSKRTTAACWQFFGLPAMSTDNDPSTFHILTGFVSCKTCFETYKYIDSSTANLNAHICCRNLDPDQSSITSFVQSPRSTTSSKVISKKKDEIKRLCTKWISSSMRSFRIVNDPGFRELIQVCIDMGKLSLS
jgi:hypothetical protein